MSRKEISNIILHIPHNSNKFPKNLGSLTVSKTTLKKFSKIICDTSVKKLFSHKIGVFVEAKYSRVYCDVEKFLDNSLEIMSKYGMGVIYTHDHLGNQIRKENEDFSRHVISNYYLPYHQNLDELTKKILNKKILIVDCHSYDEKIVVHNKQKIYSDICIGYDTEFYDDNIVMGVANIFMNNGYSVSFNNPFSGCMIPSIVLKSKLKNCYGFMIEINKRIYLKSIMDFFKCKKTIKLVLHFLKDYMDNLNL